MIILQNGQRFTEHKYQLEADFEKEIADSQKAIFGKDTIYIDTKRKIGSEALGDTIPDGFLFDMSDPDNFEFYLVEVELEKHDFYRHIFPQITKFFAFYKNSKRQKELVEKLFSTINTDSALKRQFKKYLGDEEIFKFLNDVIDSSQNILMIIDGNKPELPEITDTYSDTWGKMVKLLNVKKFVHKKESIFTVDPEFETIEFSYEETPTEAEKKSTIYSEEFHLEGVGENVKSVYENLKKEVLDIDDSVFFNPQKYYISLKSPKNIVYLKFRKKKVRMVVMMPEDQVRVNIKHHPVKTLSAGVQQFYNGPCAAIDVQDVDKIDEIINLISMLIKSENSEAESK